MSCIMHGRRLRRTVGRRCLIVLSLWCSGRASVDSRFVTFYHRLEHTDSLFNPSLQAWQLTTCRLVAIACYIVNCLHGWRRLDQTNSSSTCRRSKVIIPLHWKPQRQRHYRKQRVLCSVACSDDRPDTPQQTWTRSRRVCCRTSRHLSDRRCRSRRSFMNWFSVDLFRWKIYGHLSRKTCQTALVFACQVSICIFSV